MDGRVVWLNGPDGRVVRTFRQGAPLYCLPGRDCRPDGFFASPAVGDINGDRIMDIIAPSYDHTVYAWSKTGTLLWRTYLEDTSPDVRYATARLLAPRDHAAARQTLLACLAEEPAGLGMFDDCLSGLVATGDPGVGTSNWARIRAGGPRGWTPMR